MFGKWFLPNIFKGFNLILREVAYYIYLSLRPACPPGLPLLCLLPALSFSSLCDDIMFFASFCLPCHHPVHFTVLLGLSPKWSCSGSLFCLCCLSSVPKPHLLSPEQLLQPPAWSLSAFILCTSNPISTKQPEPAFKILYQILPLPCLNLLNRFPLPWRYYPNSLTRPLRPCVI